jgi:hypothetical protein
VIWGDAQDGPMGLGGSNGALSAHAATGTQGRASHRRLKGARKRCQAFAALLVISRRAIPCGALSMMRPQLMRES